MKYKWKWNNREKTFNQKEEIVKEQLNSNEDMPLSKVMGKNVDWLKKELADCSDLVFRPFLIRGTIEATLIYFAELVNVEEIDEQVLSPLMKENDDPSFDLLQIVSKTIPVGQVRHLHTLHHCVECIIEGHTVLLINGQSHAYAFDIKKFESRTVEDPIAESVIRGPREGFVETIHVNLSLLRRKIKTPRLKMKQLTLGRYTRTQVVISYIEGLATHDIVEEVVNRIKRIDIDGVIESGYIEEFIEDHPYSPFPQVLETERPDVAAASLLEGRVVIIVDGSPFVIIVPMTIYALLQAPEDYYQRSVMSTMIRWLRVLFFLISLLMPSLYVAILTYHQEMVPTDLLIQFAAAREQLPFPALVEALLMEVMFEALREAGLRLPKQAGAAVSIVGALVIGETAVAAGLVSEPMVMVVAITGIASFTIPRYSAAISLRILRFPIIILAGTFGLIGIMLGILTILIHLSTVRSFGVPYLSPLAPFNKDELKDVLIRAPLWSMRTRPHFTGPYNKYREAENQKPDPSKGGDRP